MNHKNGNKLDNRLENLEWNTDSENIAHAYRNNLNHSPNKKVRESDLKVIYDRYIKGERLYEIVLDYDFNLSTASTHLSRYVKQNALCTEYKKAKASQRQRAGATARHKTVGVIMLDKVTGEELKRFESLVNAAEFLGKTTAGPISNNLYGKTSSAYGYKWVRV